MLKRAPSGSTCRRRCLEDPLSESHIVFSGRFHQAAQYAPELDNEEHIAGPPFNTTITKLSRGVVTIIYPFNWPLAILAASLPAALMSGNTVIVKPPPTTPLSSVQTLRHLVRALPPAIIYLSVTSARERGIAGAFHWLGELLSLRSGHRFLGVLNWILLLALLSNFTTGFFILGSAPMLTFPRLPLHAYALENWARLAHDVGTAFIVASFSGQIYLRLIPGNQWMLKTMFAGYEARA